MSTSFRDASMRHLDDGERLYSARRFANADQLFGLSAECALKSVMHALGMAVSKAGSPRDRGHKVHMPEQWAAFQSFAQGALAARYLDPLEKTNPFADWKVDQRYWKDGAVSRAVTEKHRAAAAQCQVSLGTLILDGVAP